MSDMHCVVVGGSHAAAQVLASIYAHPWPGRVTLISAEPTLPYHRPPLSKSYLSGDTKVDDILIRGPAFYQKPGLCVRLGARVVRIVRAKKKVVLDDGSEIDYDTLVLATGARVRRASMPGHALRGVYYLRDASDADRIREHLQRTRNALVIGGGYIGLEAAASMRKAGIDVAVLEAQARVLQRVTTPEMADFYTRVHREEGVRVITGASVERINGDGCVRSVTLASGEVIDAQLVIVGIGVTPDTEIAQAAGLTVDDGIVVDEFCRTSEPSILAAGDCTRQFSHRYGRSLRLESVQNATDQAKVVVDTLRGTPRRNGALPWFWSDQYDVKLQIAGLSQGFERVVLRGNPKVGRSFAAFYFKENDLLAVDAVNRPKEFMACRKALSEGRSADPVLLADESVPLESAFSGTANSTNQGILS